MSLLVVKALGLITVQDLGRRGHMREALPAGGALVPTMFAQANRRVGNPDDAAAIEICGRLEVRASVVHRIATPREERVLQPEEEIEIASDPMRVTYLAIAGGVGGALVLGSRAAHLSAGIGSLIRTNDRIEVDAIDRVDRERFDGERELQRSGRVEDPAMAIRVIAGPDRDAFTSDAMGVFLRTEWRISSSSDRVGTRLDGSVIERRADYVEQSRPMVIGAIEVPRDGAPIVLGPEHPTTGGYPILAVIASDDLDAFHSIPLGGTVRFRV